MIIFRDDAEAVDDLRRLGRDLQRQDLDIRANRHAFWTDRIQVLFNDPTVLTNRPARQISRLYKLESLFIAKFRLAKPRPKQLHSSTSICLMFPSKLALLSEQLRAEERQHHHEATEVTLLHESTTLSILHKPAGMPITGNKPVTLLKTSYLGNRRHTILAAVPRPMSGPAIITFTETTQSQPGFLFTFFAIVHCTADTVPQIPGLSISHQRTIPSTSGPLSSLLIRSPAPGQGLRKRLLGAGAPGVGTSGDARTTRCATRAIYIACTRVQIPTLSIDVSVPLPAGFSTLLEREERYALQRIARARQRIFLVGGATRVKFLGFSFQVANTMKPRESTEIVANIAAHWLKRAQKPGYTPKILDLGTGCGAILISAILHAGKGHGVGVDNSLDAVQAARSNAKDHGLKDVEIIHGDFGEVNDIGLFDVVVSNPPYLTKSEVRKDAWFFDSDPEPALLAGQDGLNGYRAIAKSIGNLLAQDGVLVLEIGASRDVAVVRGLFGDVGLVFLDLIKDFRGFDRCLVLRNPG